VDDLDPVVARLGEPGDTCHACGAVLGTDQRYCLNCGTRRADARVPFLALLAPPASAGGAAAAPVPAAAPRGGGPWERLGGLWPAAIVVLCALALGVLIGRSGRDRVAPISQAPPVVNVTQAGAGATPAATTPEAPASSEAAATPAKKKSASAAKDKDAGATVSPTDLKKNEKLSGKDYTEKSKKLPATTKTGGKTLPKDDKAPGAGSEADTIG